MLVVNEKKVEDIEEITKHMEENIELKYKDFTNGIKIPIYMDRTTIFRKFKEWFNMGPKDYYECLKLKFIIDEIVDEKINTSKELKEKIKKYNYANKKELNKKCDKYIKKNIDTIMKDGFRYKFAKRFNKEQTLEMFKFLEDLFNGLERCNIANVNGNIMNFTIELTLDKMPIFSVKQSDYNYIQNEFLEGKYGQKEFLLKVATIDKSIKEKNNNIQFDDLESEILNTAYTLYNLFNPIKIQDMVYIGVDNEITYRYLKQHGITEKIKGTLKKECINVRYLGSTPAIRLFCDKLNTYFFTADMTSDIKDCTIDFTLDLRESDVKILIDKVYRKHKFKPMHTENRCTLSKSTLESKIDNFIYGQEMKVEREGNSIVSILDFYPKVQLTTSYQVLDILDWLIGKIEESNRNNLNLSDTIMSSGYDAINKVIRFVQQQRGKHMYEYLNKNFKNIDYIEDLLADISFSYRRYINKSLSENEFENIIVDRFKRMNIYLDAIVGLRNSIMY